MADPATDPQNTQDTESNLEEQVEGLLSEVMETVEEINRKLDDEPDPIDEMDSGAVLDDEGLAAPIETADDSDGLKAEHPVPDTESSEAEPAVTSSSAEPTDEIDPVADPDPEIEDVQTALEEAIKPEQPEDETSESEPAEATSSDLQDATEAEPGIEDVQSALEEALESEPTENVSAEAPVATEPEPGVDDVQSALQDILAGKPDPSSENEPAEPAEDAERAVAEDHAYSGPLDDKSAEEEDAPTEDETDPAPAGDVDPDAPESSVPDYGDVDSLDDELAALACDALDDDLEDSFEAVGPETSPAPDAETPPPSAPTAETEAPSPETAPADAVVDEPVPEVAPAATTTPETAAAPATGPSTPSEARASRWGWLPPKPDWPQVYSKLRPLIIAWRHIKWVTPPLLGFVWRWLLVRLKPAEPKVRQAMAIVAGPLSKQEPRVRSAIGWLAVWTVFWSASLWVYILFARSPATPEATETPTSLAGEQAVASGDTQP